MNTSDADLERLIKEIVLEDRRLRRKNQFPIVGEFITLVMFVAPQKVGEGIIDVIRLLIKRLRHDSA